MSLRGGFVTFLDTARGKGAQVNERLARIESALEQAGKGLSAAQDWAAPRAAAAQEWAAPRVEAAVERTKEDIAPKVLAALAAGAAASAPVVEEAKHRGGLALHALQGHEVVLVEKKRRWPRRLAILILLAGAAAGIASYLSKRRQEESAFSIDAETRPTYQTHPPADDRGGASPDEALADVADSEQHATTTLSDVDGSGFKTSPTPEPPADIDSTSSEERS